MQQNPLKLSFRYQKFIADSSRKHFQTFFFVGRKVLCAQRAAADKKFINHELVLIMEKLVPFREIRGRIFRVRLFICVMCCG